MLVDILLPSIVILTHLIVSPYTKVEESFNLQATHDIIRYGIPSENASAMLKEKYDHFTFPGAVPRSFVGSLVLARLSQPVIELLGGWVNEQVIVRGVLGLSTAFSLIIYTRSVKRAYGRTTSVHYAFLQLSQFHLPYYASRPLPNTFALVLSTVALSFLLPRPAASPSYRRISYMLGLALLTFTTVVFRSELAILVALQSLYLMLQRRVSLLTDVIPAGVIGGVMGLTATLCVDSFFWQSNLPDAPFSTPFLTEKFGVIWPEFSAFWYNTVENRASEWGTSPWYYYFTSAIPKLLLNPYTMAVGIPLAALATRGTFDILLPLLGYVAVYSYLPHKEWRFIIYIIPGLTTLGARGSAWIWDRRAKSFVYGVLSLGLVGSILSSFAASAGMLAVSSQNYPGGEALQRLHAQLSRLPPLDGGGDDGDVKTIVVHLDSTVCMTGATRFLQEAPLFPGVWNSTATTAVTNVRFDKTESKDTLLTPGFWNTIDWALTSDLSKPIGNWKVVESVSAFKRIRIYLPGERVKRIVSMVEEIAEELGLDGEGEEVEKGWFKRLLEDGMGVREMFFGGWWLGIEMEEMVWVVRREDILKK